MKYFGIMETFEMKGYGDRAASTLSSDVEFSHESSSVPHIECQEKQTRISIGDDFVSILLTFRMEHKDYATVFYDQSVVSCTLSMPDNVRISMSRRGHYEVSMEDQINLKVKNHGTHTHNQCNINYSTQLIVTLLQHLQ